MQRKFAPCALREMPLFSIPRGISRKWPQLTSLVFITVNFSVSDRLFHIWRISIHSRGETVCGSSPPEGVTKLDTTFFVLFCFVLFYVKSSVFLSLNHLYLPRKHFNEHMPFLLTSFFFFFDLAKISFLFTHRPPPQRMKQNPGTAIGFANSRMSDGDAITGVGVGIVFNQLFCF